MKKFQLVLVAMFAATALMAQDYVYLYYNNGKVDEVAISDFDSLSFTKPESKTTGEAERKDGEGTVKVKWVQLWENGPKWAEYNVGAKSVGEYGGYYCWGKTIDKDPNGDYYDGEENIQGGSHDTAKNLWGDNWQMATKEDFDALLANCDVQWTTNYNGTGKAGRVYTGKTEGYTENSVFFPAAGFYYDGEVLYAGSYGYYWSSTPNGGSLAYSLGFYSSDQVVDDGSRYSGQSVRAVLNEGN